MNFIASHLSVAKVVWIASILLLLVSATNILRPWLWLLYERMGETWVEVALYWTVVALLIGAHEQQGYKRTLLAFTACMLFIVPASLTEFHIQGELRNHFMTGACVALWTPSALWFESSSIGFIAVLAFCVFLGFFATAIPSGYIIGFQGGGLLKDTVVAFFITLLYPLLDLASSRLRVFRVGALTMGPLLCFVGGLILSNKYYLHNTASSWIVYNAAFIAYTLACFFIGSLNNRFKLLHNFAIVFSVLYVMSKYAEIPWGEWAWTWGALGAGLLLYVSSFYTQLLLKSLQKDMAR